MLKNNIEIDVKVKSVEEQTTQAELAEKTGTSPSCGNRLINSPEKIVNNTFVKMLEIVIPEDDVIVTGGKINPKK